MSLDPDLVRRVLRRLKIALAPAVLFCRRAYMIFQFVCILGFLAVSALMLGFIVFAHVAFWFDWLRQGLPSEGFLIDLFIWLTSLMGALNVALALWGLRQIKRSWR